MIDREAPGYAGPMNAELVRCYFDFVSPYAYLGWRRLPAIAARHGASVEPIPVLFAGLLNAHGHKGPAEIPAKRAWVWRNVLRKARRVGIPIGVPAFHPFNPLLALRICSLDRPPEERSALIGLIFDGIWQSGVHPSEPDEMSALLAGAGFPADELLAAARRPEAKQKLREQTEAAIAAGVFGVPTFEHRGQWYWGEEELTFLDQALAGDDPLAGADLSAMENLRPSAQR